MWDRNIKHPNFVFLFSSLCLYLFIYLFFFYTYMHAMFGSFKKEIFINQNCRVSKNWQLKLLIRTNVIQLKQQPSVKSPLNTYITKQEEI
jgi:hypothetical protein